MAIVYFDASAFIKLLVEEDGTEVAVALWDGCDAAVSSRLSYPEVRAALAAAARDRRVSAADLDRAEQDWEIYWSAVRPVELTAEVARRAGVAVKEHSLRGVDGVHLASVFAVPTPDIVMAVWDRRLRDGALAAGLQVAPAPEPGRTPRPSTA